MACTFNIKADNGKNSLLFKSIAANTANPNEAVDLYYFTKTKEFKEIYGDWENKQVDISKLDINGEPLYSSFSEEAYIHDVDYNAIELESRATVVKQLGVVIPTIVDTLTVNINRLESLGKKGSEDTIQKLKDLKDTFETESIDSGMLTFVAMSSKHISHLKDLMEKELLKPTPNFRKVAGLHKATQAYGVLYDVQAQLQKDPLVKSIFAPQLVAISSSIGDMVSIESNYVTHSSDYLVEEFHKRNSGWSKSDIRQSLSTAPRDTKWTEQMLEYMGDSHDPVLAAVAEVVINQEHEIRRIAIDFNTELQEAIAPLEAKNKGKSMEDLFKDVIYQKDNGELHIVDLAAVDTGGKDKAMDAQYRAVQKIKSDPEMFQFYTFFYAKYMEMQKLVPQTAMMGTRIPTVLKSTYERMEGKGLAEKYSFMSDGVKKHFQRSNTDMEMGMILDSGGKPLQRIPTFYTQKYDSRDYSKFYDQKYNELTADGKLEEEAHTLADAFATSEATKETAKFISQDLIASLQNFHAMAINYAKKNEIIEIVDSALAVVGSDNRKYTIVDSAGRVIKNKLLGLHDPTQYTKGNESRSKKVLEQFIESKVYGQTEKDLGFISILGLGEIDTNKLLRQINSSTSTIQLVGNVTAAIANVLNGEYNNFMESIAGEYYTKKDYAKITGLYTKEIGGMLKDFTNRTPENFINLMEEKYAILQDFSPTGSIQGTEATSAKRKLKTDLGFFMTNAGEHFMQIRTGLSIMNNIKTYSKDGTETGTLFDAHSSKDGKVVIAPDTYVKGKDGKIVPYDTQEQDRVSNYMNAVTRKLYGNYSAKTAMAAKQDARTAMVLKFREWAYEGLTRRFGKEQDYLMLEQKSEGFYRTGASVTGKMIKDLKNFNLTLMKEDWQKLTPHEKANVRRFVTETATVTLLFTSGALLSHMGKGIEDDKNGSFADRAKLGAFRMLTYQVNRLYTEVFAYANPVEALRLMQSPVASATIMENTVKLIQQVFTDPTEQYTTGWRKGEYKVMVRAEKLIPLYKQIKTLNPDGLKDKGTFYNL